MQMYVQCSTVDSCVDLCTEHNAALCSAMQIYVYHFIVLPQCNIVQCHLLPGNTALNESVQHLCF